MAERTKADLELDAFDVRTAFYYDGAIGRLRRKISASHAKVDSIAGTTCGCGYRQVRFRGRLYSEQRLIWLWVHGRHPTAEIDHINGDRADNRNKIATLVNRLKGTTPTKGGRWRAQICVNYDKIYLGTFDTELAAHKAYKAAAIQYFGEFARI